MLPRKDHRRGKCFEDFQRDGGRRPGLLQRRQDDSEFVSTNSGYRILGPHAGSNALAHCLE